MKIKKIHKNDFDGYLQFGSLDNFLKLTGRDKHLERQKKTQSYFFNKINQKKNQKRRNCIICNSSKKELIFIKHGFKHHKCINCGFFYVDPILNEEITHSTFLEEDSYTKVLLNKKNIYLDKIKFQYGLQRLGINLKNKTLLDIGCGYGFFLDVAKKLGCQVFGSELNESCLSLLKKKKINIIKNFEENYGKFDIISMWLVLEHIADPSVLLKQIHSLLKKNGRLIVNVPNSKSLTARILKQNCTMFSGEQHINFFSLKNLKIFLLKNNFKTLFTETIISDIGTIKKSLKLSKDINDLDEEKELDFLTPEFIHRRNLGYTIFNISRKIDI